MANDITMFCESWGIQEQHFEMEGFASHCFHRKFISKRAWRASGGIVVYIKNSIKK